LATTWAEPWKWCLASVMLTIVERHVDRLVEAEGKPERR
jgi:hypothetical protein